MKTGMMDITLVANATASGIGLRKDILIYNLNTRATTEYSVLISIPSGVNGPHSPSSMDSAVSPIAERFHGRRGIEGEGRFTTAIA